MDETEISVKKPNRVRYPLMLHVDKIEVEPKVDKDGAVRTAYDVIIYEYDMRKLYEALKKGLESKVIIPMKVRIIGRLES